MRYLWALVPFRDGLVAAVDGDPRTFDSIDLRLWRSADGIRWRRAGSLSPSLPGGPSTTVASVQRQSADGRGRLVVLGTLTHSSGSGGWSPSGWLYASGRQRTSPRSDRLLGWTSRGGARWVQRRLGGALRHGISGSVGSVWDTASRLLAVRLGGYREGAVLSSEDGLDWSVVAPLPEAHEDGGSEGLIAPSDSVMVFADHADWGDGDYGNRLGGWRLEADGTWDEVIYRKPAFSTSQAAEGDAVIVTGFGWDHSRQWAWTLVSFDGGRTWDDGSSWTGANGSCLGDVAIRRGVAVMVGCDPSQTRAVGCHPA